MSQAFVRESEGEWVHDVCPSLPALINYLTRENNDVSVYVKKSFFSEKHGRDLHEMSNGFNYAKDNDGKWYIAE